MWCGLRKPVTCRTEWNCKIRQINNIILFSFIFDSLWTSVTFDTSMTEGQSKKFWKEDIPNFHMILTTQIWYFAPCDVFSQITSHFQQIFEIDSWLNHLGLKQYYEIMFRSAPSGCIFPIKFLLFYIRTLKIDNILWIWKP